MLTPIAVREVMSTSVETISPDESAHRAAEQLSGNGIGSLVVCENGRPVGIITDVDMSRLVAEGRDPESATVEEFMASPLVTTTPDATIEEAATTLREHHIKRLPVVEDGKAVGIITTSDLSNYLPHLVRMGREQEPDATRARHDVRVDTAYEDDSWDFEYLGDEASIAVGDTVKFSKTISESDVESFAQISGDTNRLHLDAEYASETRFGERIVHGTLVTGIISSALARLPGLIIYLSQDVSYLGPVPLEERVTANCRVVERLGERQFRLSTAVERADGETVIDGEAVVISDTIPD